MQNIPQDITGEIFDLCPAYTGSCPMYSFSRPAYVFWQGFYEGMIGSGISHEKAMEVLQSKGVRHMLDDKEEEIREMGEKMGRKFCVRD
jgi:hypothetical protein